MMKVFGLQVAGTTWNQPTNRNHQLDTINHNAAIVPNPHQLQITSSLSLVVQRFCCHGV
jgi:hypothetical protein